RKTTKMAAFKKGQEYRPPYDQGMDAESKAGIGLDRDNSYPTRKPNVYGAGPPMGSIKGEAGFPTGAIDFSYLDEEVVDGQGFGDAKGKGGWSKAKSDAATGGFSGSLPGGAGNHPTRRGK